MSGTNTPVLYRQLYTRYKKLFWIFLTGALITGYWQVLQNKQLSNEAAPKGIMSLQLENTMAGDTSIIWSWKKTVMLDSSQVNECKPPGHVNLLNLAKSNIQIDFVFIFFYVCLAIVIISWIQDRAGVKWAWATNLLICLAVIAGLMDIVENTGILKFINYGLGERKELPGETVAKLISTAAHIKFYILGALIFLYLPYMLIIRNQGLRTLSAYIQRRMEQVFRYRVIFLGVIAFGVPMWILDQGQDLLVNSNAAEWGIILFLLAVVIIALLNWYLAKLFFTKKYAGPVYPFNEREPTEPQQLFAEKKVSRFLGVAAIVIPAAAILNALQITHIRYRLDIIPPATTLVILLSIFFVLIKHDIASKAYHAIERSKGRRTANITGIVAISLLAVVIPLTIRLRIGNISHTPLSLIYLYWHFILLAFAFYIFVSIRTCVFPGNGWLGKGIGKLVFVLATMASLAFIWINLKPLSLIATDIRFTTLPFLITGAIFYIFVFTLLIRLSQKLKINFVFFIIVIGLILSIINSNNYHSVYSKYYPPRPKALELEDYFREWVLARKDEIQSDSVYPVFLINTYGGGIRAAAFTSMALTFLDSTLLKQGKHGFQHYAFSISGASGGTIGAAVNCAYRHKHLDEMEAYRQDVFYQFYQHDFLTPVLITDMGRDVWASATTLSIWNDRAAVQEKAWTRFADRHLSMDLGVHYDSIWSLSSAARYEVPLLFSNTLNVDDGLKGICAPVHLKRDDFPATIFIRDRMDSINAHRKIEDSVHNISLITGAFLSARFPFISPGGKMGAGYHFIDGGGKDNSGASTSELIFEALARYADKQRETGSNDSMFVDLVSRIRFYFVSINNSPTRTEARKLVENRFELISPVVGIVNSGIDGNARAANSTLQIRYSDTTKKHQGFRTGYFSIAPTVDCIIDSSGNNYVPILPLGWQISEPALMRLRNTFDTINLKKSVGITGVLQVARRITGKTVIQP